MAQDKPARTNRILPYPLAMVICDHIWVDPGTGKKTLLGLFSTIHAKKFPVTHGLLAVHVSLTDGHGETPIRLCLVDAKGDGDPILDETGTIDFTDPRIICDIAFHAANVLFQKPGEYRFQLFAHKELLMERRVLLVDTGDDQ